MSPYAVAIGASKARLDLDVTAVRPSQLLKPLLKRRHSGLSFPIVGRSHQQPDAPHALALLPARRDGPRGCGAYQRDEIASSQLVELHSVPRQPGPDCRIPNWRGSASEYDRHFAPGQRDG